MREEAPNGEGAPAEEEDARQPLYIGVDVARFGDDKSVLCARRGQRVVAIKSFGRIDTMRVAGETALMARELGAEAVFVDEDGIGAGVVDRLRELERARPWCAVRAQGAAPHALRQPALRDLLGTAPPHQRPLHCPAGRRGARRATPLPALRCLQLRPGADGEQARTAQEEASLARPRRRPCPRVHDSAVAHGLDRLRIVPAPTTAPARRRPGVPTRRPRHSCGGRNDGACRVASAKRTKAWTPPPRLRRTWGCGGDGEPDGTPVPSFLRRQEPRSPSGAREAGIPVSAGMTRPHAWRNAP